MLLSATNRHSKWLLVVCAVLAAFLGLSIWFRSPKAHAQPQRNDVSKPAPAPTNSSGAGKEEAVTPEILPMPAPDPVEAKVAETNEVIAQKMKFAAAIDKKIAALLQVISMCEQSTQDLTHDVINAGPEVPDSVIQQMRHRITQLKKTAAAARYQVALFAIAHSNLDWRTAQLMEQVVNTLRPNPDRLLKLRKKYNIGVSDIVGGISAQDPNIGVSDMERISAQYPSIASDLEHISAEYQARIRCRSRTCLQPGGRLAGCRSRTGAIRT